MGRGKWEREGENGNRKGKMGTGRGKWEWEGENGNGKGKELSVLHQPERVGGVTRASSCLACPGRGNFSLMHDRFHPHMGQRKPSVDGFRLISITVIKTFAHTS